MTKFSFLLFACLLSHNFILAQKLYVWCPDEQNVKARTGFLEGQQINLVVFDGRTIPPKSKIECESSSVVEALANYIKKAYPSAKINLLGDEAYYKKPEANIITLKVAISAFHAGFGSDISVGIGSVGGSFSYGVFPKGEWNGLTSYYAQVFDNRNGTAKKDQKEIVELASKPNMFGYKTAKTCLNTTYIQANQKLLFFIDGLLME